ncbi:MAG TPA: ketopantoate reductase C-terminal domain-containing protein [Gemmataceae bacterium]|nr:ketopantoate reductase C-terminal domain-containing protein [Gemmataceae bacterium]
MEPFYIVGAGGIGCAIGYALSTSGSRVIFVEAQPEKVRWGRRHGVRVDRRPPQRAEFVPFDEWAPAPEATVFLCTKCYDNAAVLARLSPSVNLIPVQNGFDAKLDVRGDHLEGIASFVSECSPYTAHTQITRGGRLHLGMRRVNGVIGKPRECENQVVRIVALLSRSRLFGTRQVPDILPYKHTKLLYNAAIGPIAAAAGLDNGQLLSVPKARHLFFELLRENYTILRDGGIRLETIGPFHPDTVHRILRRRWLAGALAWAFYPSLRGSYCSMNGDLLQGRTEIDNYNRYLIELAGDRPCPLNRRTYALIRRMEREHISPCVSVLDGLSME